MPIKSIKMNIFETRKCFFPSCVKDHLTQKNRFLCQKVSPVACSQTDTQTCRHIELLSYYSGHPFRASWFIFFNLDIITDRLCNTHNMLNYNCYCLTFLMLYMTLQQKKWQIQWSHSSQPGLFIPPLSLGKGDKT